MAGVSYRSAQLDLLERTTYRGAELRQVGARALTTQGLDLPVVLSTCSRTEIYAASADPEKLVGFLSWDRGIPWSELEVHAYRRRGEGVVAHLFRVTSGLDSAVLGEDEIQGQVRDAYRGALDVGELDAELDCMFRTAIACGRRVRSETALGGSRRSLAEEAVQLAGAGVGGVAGRTAVVVGSGKMAKAVANRLGAGGAEVLVCCRNHGAGMEIAGQAGSAASLTNLPALVADADLVFCCSSAPHFVLSDSVLREIMQTRLGAKLFILDLAMPRNVDPAARDISGIVLADLEDLARLGAQHAAALAAAVLEAEDIVLREMRRYLAWSARRLQAGELCGSTNAL